MKLKIRNEKGSTAAEAVIFAAVIVFVLFPVFAGVIEKYIVENKVRIIKDAVDMSAVSAYNTVTAERAGRSNTDPGEHSEIETLFKELLAYNLNLNPDLTPKSNSIAEGPVTIVQLEVYTADMLPIESPSGKFITRPAVYVGLTVPIKPSLYRQTILNMLGKQYVEINMHVDVEIPKNN